MIIMPECHTYITCKSTYILHASASSALYVFPLVGYVAWTMVNIKVKDSVYEEKTAKSTSVCIWKIT